MPKYPENLSQKTWDRIFKELRADGVGFHDAKRVLDALEAGETPQLPRHPNTLAHELLTKSVPADQAKKAADAKAKREATAIASAQELAKQAEADQAAAE